jgi:hypothetical protein
MRKEKRGMVYFLLMVFLFAGCAAPVTYTAGKALLQSMRVDGTAGPQTLRAVLKITVYDGRKKSTVTGVVNTVPRQRYKIDFKGPVGSHLGSFYWVKDSVWSLFVPKEELLIQGDHDRVYIPILKLDSVVIHDVLGFLWGGYLPAGEYAKDEKEKDMYRTTDGRAGYAIDARSGLVRRAVLSSGYVMEYGGYTEQNGRPVAGSVAIHRNNMHLLDIKTKTITDNPTWKKSPFFLRLPGGMMPVSPEEAERVGLLSEG